MCAAAAAAAVNEAAAVAVCDINRVKPGEQTEDCPSSFSSSPALSNFGNLVIHQRWLSQKAPETHPRLYVSPPDTGLVARLKGYNRVSCDSACTKVTVTRCCACVARSW
nr:unnamed protein product [Spirometra erinaceieuropaei]